MWLLTPLRLCLLLALIQSRPLPLALAAEDKLPPDVLYFGWFFSESIATSLQTITDSYLKQAFDSIGPVQKFLKNISDHEGITNPLQLFQKPLDPATGAKDPKYHVTAMFCGNQDCSNYYDQIKGAISKQFQMTLIGIFFTGKTFGVRVFLTKEQEQMFDETKLKAKSVVENFAVADYPGIEFIKQDPDFSPSMSKAHITLGCAPDVPAVQTGPDLLSVVEYENNPNVFNFTQYSLNNVGEVRQYFTLAEQNVPLAFVFYLDEKMVTTATFEAYYNRTGNGASANAISSFTLISLISSNFILMFTD